MAAGAVLAMAAPAYGAATSTALNAVIGNLTDWLVGILAGVATLFLTIGGLRYLTAGRRPRPGRAGQDRPQVSGHRLRPGRPGAGDRLHPCLSGRRLREPGAAPPRPAQGCAGGVGRPPGRGRPRRCRPPRRRPGADRWRGRVRLSWLPPPPRQAAWPPHRRPRHQRPRAPAPRAPVPRPPERRGGRRAASRSARGAPRPPRPAPAAGGR